MGIIFSEGSGLNDSVFGKCQMPIKMFLEKRAESFEAKSMLKEFFCMDTSDQFAVKYSGMTAMDGPDPVGENGDYPSDSMQEGYSKTVEPETWKDSFSISQEMIEDGKLLDMKKQPSQFMAGWNRNRETFGAAIFGGAMHGQKVITYKGKQFDISCADGLSVFNTKHKPMITGGVQSNLFSNAFSVDALDRAEAAMQQFRGENGEVLALAPTSIAIANHPALKRKVFAAIGADQDPDSAGNGFNFQFGRWRVKIWNYLNQFVTDLNEPWMLIDDDFNEEVGGAVWIDRVPLTIKSEIAANDANIWKGRARFVGSFNDWRFACLGGIADGTDLTTLKI